MASSELQATDPNNLTTIPANGVNRDSMVTTQTFLTNMTNPLRVLTFTHLDNLIHEQPPPVNYDRYDVVVNPYTMPHSYKQKLINMRVPHRVQSVFDRPSDYMRSKHRNRVLPLPDVDSCKLDD